MKTKVISIQKEPVRKEEAYDQCYLIDPDMRDVALFSRLIPAAREFAEARTWRGLAKKTIEGSLDKFPDVIEVPFPAIGEVTELKYTDKNEEVKTLVEGTDFVVDDFSEPARIVPITDWPETSELPNAVKITYTTKGYCPDAVKHAILYLVKHFYDNRDMVIVGEGVRMSAEEVPLTALHLLDPYSVRRFV